MLNILKLLLKVAGFVGVFFLVFWMENKTINIVTLWDKITSPQSIVLYDDILIHSWTLLIILSFYMNILGIQAAIWFYKGINNGKVRVGGKEVND